MSVENTKPNVMAQDNPELDKVFNELGMDIKNNPFLQMIAQAFSALDTKPIFREPAANVSAGFDGRYMLEYSYNEDFTGAEDKFTKVIADKLDDYTFKALLTNGHVECKIKFTFSDTSFLFNWDNDLKHFVGVKDDDVECEYVYNEIDAKFVCKEDYLKSLNDIPTEENEDTTVLETEDNEEEEEEEEVVCEDACTPIENVPCPEKCDTSFADRLYEKLNKKFQDENFNKYKEDLIIALHRIFDYGMYEPGFDDSHSEIDKVKFTLEDVLMMCPREKVGKFWDTISSQKIVGLIADEFKFRSVKTYLDQANGKHCVICNLK